MAANDRLVIFRGDDTGGAFGRRLSFVITAAEGVSLDGCRAEWVFDGIVKEFAAPIVSGEEREIFYSHNETRCMRPGVRFGTFRIVDAAGKVRTFDNTRPVEVTDSVSRCYPGSSSATVFVGTTVSWDQVSGKPPLVKTINGEPPDADGNIDVASGGTVKSATVNGGKKVVPTADGNLALTVPSSVESVNSKTGAVRLMAKDIPYNDEGDTTEEAVDGLAQEFVRHRDDEDIHVSSSDRAEWADKYTRTEVDEKINEFAAHYLTADAAGNAFATAAALKSATAYYYAGATHTPDKNDYCIVRADEDHKTAAGISPTTRYFYVGDVAGDGRWVYAYTINETALTQAQIAALDSGITASKVAEFDAKQDKLTDAQLANIDAVPQKRDKDDLFTLWEADGVEGQPVYDDGNERFVWPVGETTFVTESGTPEDFVGRIEFVGEFSSFFATRKKIATTDDLAGKQNALSDAQLANIDAVPQKRDRGDFLTDWEFGGDSGDWSVKFREAEIEEGGRFVAQLFNGESLACEKAIDTLPDDTLEIEFRWGEDNEVNATRKKIATVDQIPSDDDISSLAADATKVNPSTSLALKDRDCCLVAYTEGMTFTFAAKEEGKDGLRSFEVIVTGCVKDGAVNWPAVTYRGDSTDLIPDDGDNHWTFAEQQDGSFAVTRHIANTFTIGD